MAVLLFSCASQQIGLKENWIDERDVIALRDMPLEEWIKKAGLPTLVEILGDTNVYYYNYRPTLYAAAVYDSTTFFKTWGTASEQKPSLANKAEVWGSRKDFMQIKVVNGLVLSAVVIEGPDKKVFIRDLNGNIVLDPNSGFNNNMSLEQKVDNSFKEYSKIFSNLQGIQPPPPAVQPPAAIVAPVAPVEPPPPAVAEPVAPPAAPVAPPVAPAVAEPVTAVPLPAPAPAELVVPPAAPQ